MPADFAIRDKQAPAASGAWLRRLMHGGDKRWFSLAVGVVLACLVLPPLLFLIEGAITMPVAGGGARLTLERFAAIFNQKGFALSAWHSFAFAIGSAALALFLGGIVAWLVERTNTPLKPLAYLTTIISMGTPYVLYEIGRAHV